MGVSFSPSSYAFSAPSQSFSATPARRSSATQRRGWWGLLAHRNADTEASCTCSVDHPSRTFVASSLVDFGLLVLWIHLLHGLLQRQVDLHSRALPALNAHFLPGQDNSDGKLGEHRGRTEGGSGDILLPRRWSTTTKSSTWRQNLPGNGHLYLFSCKITRC